MLGKFGAAVLAFAVSAQADEHDVNVIELSLGDIIEITTWLINLEPPSFNLRSVASVPIPEDAGFVASSIKFQLTEDKQLSSDPLAGISLSIFDAIFTSKDNNYFNYVMYAEVEFNSTLVETPYLVGDFVLGLDGNVDYLGI